MIEGETSVKLLYRILYLYNVSFGAKLLFQFAVTQVSEINIHRPQNNMNFSI